MLEPPVAIPFPDDIDSLLSQTPATAVPPEYRHLCIMSVLLGRITMFTRVGDRFPVSQEALERALWRVFERTLEPYQIAEDIPHSHLRNLMLPGCLTLASAIMLNFSTATDLILHNTLHSSKSAGPALLEGQWARHSSQGRKNATCCNRRAPQEATADLGLDQTAETCVAS
jgi:hypothetical protein